MKLNVSLVCSSSLVRCQYSKLIYRLYAYINFISLIQFHRGIWVSTSTWFTYVGVGTHAMVFAIHFKNRLTLYFACSLSSEKGRVSIPKLRLGIIIARISLLAVSIGIFVKIELIILKPFFVFSSQNSICSLVSNISVIITPSYLNFSLEASVVFLKDSNDSFLRW